MNENQNTNNENESSNAPKRRSLRLLQNTNVMLEDDLSPSVRYPEPKVLPFIKYSGAIKYYTDSNEIAETSDMIMQWVDKQIAPVVPLSFDMEWPFSWTAGPGKSSVIQICVQLNCCYVFHLTNLKKLPAALMALLKHPKVRLHGVNIKNDFRKLARDFPEVNADILIEKCTELGSWCNEVCETGGRWSLERLSNYIMKLAMDKNKKVRMSRWHVVPLDKNQLMYAAIDVYIGLMIYQELERREKLKKANEEEFLKNNGIIALKAIKALGETFLEFDNKTN